jgi:hypothetical protein
MKRLGSIVVVGVIVCACGGSSGTELTDGGGGSDTGTDGSSVTDGSSNQDSSSSDASDAANCPDFCATITPTPAFCSDFDSESMPADSTQLTTSMGGAVTIEQADQVSCPNGLAATLPQITGQGQDSIADAKVRKDVASIATVTEAIVKLDGYLPSNDMASYVSFFGVRSTTDPKSGIYLTHHGDAFWFLTQGGFGLNVGVTPAPLTGAWNEMTLDVVFGNQSTDKVTFTYTGVDNATHVVTCSGAQCCGGSTCAGVTASAPVASVSVEIGMEASGNTEAAFATYYDNVVLTTK